MGVPPPYSAAPAAPQLGPRPHVAGRRRLGILPAMRDDALSVIVSGSSAAMATTGYLSWLRQEIDLPLRVLLTHSAERFVRREAVAWYADEVYASDAADLNPTEFARRSLGVVVLPATAHTLAAAALGLASTPAQTAILACPRPVLFFPSMNQVMWRKPPIRRHVATLREDGHTVVEPREGPVFELWRRENAMGLKLAPPDEAAEVIVGWLEAILGEEEAPGAGVPAPEDALLGGELAEAGAPGTGSPGGQGLA